MSVNLLLICIHYKTEFIIVNIYASVVEKNHWSYNFYFLDDGLSEFGGLVSTSNTYCTEDIDVHIQCSNPVIWTMGWK